ncbi:predicted protein [Postia placenta Mad-698-R]|nr:predicted protein [Postia placenta Mad-698-R]
MPSLHVGSLLSRMFARTLFSIDHGPYVGLWLSAYGGHLHYCALEGRHLTVATCARKLAAAAAAELFAVAEMPATVRMRKRLGRVASENAECVLYELDSQFLQMWPMTSSGTGDHAFQLLVVLERFKEDTDLDLLSTDGIHDSLTEKLKAVNDASSLWTVVHAQYEGNTRMRSALDSVFTSSQHLFLDVTWIVDQLRDVDRANARRKITFRALAALVIGSEDINALKAISHLFRGVPQVAHEVLGSLSLAAEADIDAVLMSYVKLVGTARRIIHIDRKHSFEAQFARGWSHTLAGHPSVAHIGASPSDFPIRITTTQKLLADVRSACIKLKLQSKDITKLRESLRGLADSITSIKVNADACGDVACGSKHNLIVLILDLLENMTKVLRRLQCTETAPPVEIPLIRIKAQTVTIAGEATRILREANSTQSWNLKLRVSSSLFAKNEVLQSAIQEFAHIVQNAIVAVNTDAAVSASQFTTMWENAKQRYMASSGIEMFSYESLEHVDSLAALDTALDSRRYKFQQERMKERDVERVIRPIIGFIKTFVDPAADLVEPHFACAKFVAAALKKLLDAADKYGSTYEPITCLFSTLSDFLDRMRVHHKHEPDGEIVEIQVEVLCEMLVIFGLITGRINKGYFGRLLVHNERDSTDGNVERLVSGSDEVQAALRRVQTLVDKEDKMTNALVLDVVHRIETTIAPPSSTAATVANAVEILQPKFPPKPVFFIGRQEQRDAIVNAILERKSVVVLGAGGMGKTTVVTEALYDDRLISESQPRYFVTCENIVTLDGLRNGVANALAIPAELRNEQLHTKVLHELGRRPSTLFLDNFETLFDVAVGRSGVEMELEAYAGVTELALVVTMRGAEAPATGRIQWAKLLLTPLSREDGIALFRKTAMIADDINDPFIDKLVDAVDSLPLAVTLLAYQVQPEFGTTARSLWSRWGRKHVGMVTRSDGARDRLLDLSTSIELSINSPRMQYEPSAKAVMALLAQLPSGLPFGTDTSEQMQDTLEDTIDLSLSLSTLCRVGLAYTDTNGAHPRYRMLAPIREYCRSHHELQPSSTLWESLTNFYITFIEKNWDYTNAVTLSVVPPELQNIRQVLALRNWEMEATSFTITAAMRYTEWMCFLGAPSVDLLQLCIAYVHDNELLGVCYNTIGVVYCHLTRWDDAEMALHQALEHHKASGSQQGEAKDLRDLAWIYQYRDDLNRARDTLEEALSLCRAIEDHLGEASALESLGDLFYRQDDIDNAETSLNAALSLYGAIDDRLGEANTLQSLGDVYCRRNDYDKAERTYKKAASLHHSLQDRLGEATDHRGLAMMYTERGDLDKAEASSRAALDLYHAIHDQLGEANSLQSLGRVYLYREDLVNAEESLKNALALHQAVQDQMGEAIDLRFLGEVYVNSDRATEAQKVLCDAVDLWRTIHEPLGEGNALRRLGEVYTKTEHFDEAETALSRAVELHRGIGADVNVRFDEATLEELRKAREESARELPARRALHPPKQAVWDLFMQLDGSRNTTLEAGQLETSVVVPLRGFYQRPLGRLCSEPVSWPPSLRVGGRGAEEYQGRRMTHAPEGGASSYGLERDEERLLPGKRRMTAGSITETEAAANSTQAGDSNLDHVTQTYVIRSGRLSICLSLSFAPSRLCLSHTCNAFCLPSAFIHKSTPAITPTLCYALSSQPLPRATIPAGCTRECLMPTLEGGLPALCITPPPALRQGYSQRRAEAATGDIAYLRPPNDACSCNHAALSVCAKGYDSNIVRTPMKRLLFACLICIKPPPPDLHSQPTRIYLSPRRLATLNGPVYVAADPNRPPSEFCAGGSDLAESSAPLCSVGRHGSHGRWALPVRNPFGSLFENMPPQVFYGLVSIREFSTCSQLYTRLHPMRHLHGTHGGSGEMKSETLDSRFKRAVGAMTRGQRVATSGLHTLSIVLSLPYCQKLALTLNILSAKRTVPSSACPSCPHYPSIRSNVLTAAEMPPFA